MGSFPYYSCALLVGLVVLMLLLISRWRCSPFLALLLSAWLLALFSGFILLSSLRQSIADRGENHPVALTTSLAGGLYATSALVPPTPGPAAAAMVLGLSPGLVIIPGMLLAFLGTMVALFWGVIVAQRYSPHCDQTVALKSALFSGLDLAPACHNSPAS